MELDPFDAPVYGTDGQRFLTVHHSKYALAKHRWDEPLKNAEEMKNKDSLNVLIPEIGEVVALEK